MTKSSPRQECFECAKQPPAIRPATPRKIDKRSGPRTPRCHTHQEAQIKASKQREADRKNEQRYGITPAEEAELRALQGGLCPCGNQIRHRDHDHELAREHAHPRDRACKACMRGLLCARCNREILARGYDSTKLRALADYLDDPPARRLWRTA